jgi:4-amino-4-deoxy-L-arabinose transferase-like glycosyltransferase
VLDGATLISEPLFVALELAAVLALLRHRRDPVRVTWAPVAGVCAGLAALTRSTGAVLALALIGGLWFVAERGRRRRRLLSMTVFAATAVLVVAPWTARNARVLGTFVPVSTEIGPTLLGTYNPAARDAPGCTGCWVLLSQTPGEEALVRRLRRLSEVQRDRESRRLAEDFARSHPGYVAQVAWHNSLRLLELGGASRTRFTASTIDVPQGAAVIGAWELWLYLALAAAGVALGALRRVPGWLVALPLVLWVTTVVAQSETPRFRAPIDPFVVLLATAGVAAVRSRVQPGGRSSTTSASIDAPPRARATDTR